jgi:hypothetical protein
VPSNVDLNMMRSWLGHGSIETTNAYVEIDLEMKRKTLQSLRETASEEGKARPIMAAQQRYPVMVVEAVVMCSTTLRIAVGFDNFWGALDQLRRDFPGYWGKDRGSNCANTNRVNPNAALC